MKRESYHWFLSKENDVLKKLFMILKNEGYRIVGPKRDDGALVLNYLNSVDEIELNYIRTLNSPKYFLIPNGECIFKWNKRDEELIIAEPDIKEKIAFFCIHPCDANSLLVLDSILLEKPIDVYYSKRRENTVVIILDCVKSDEYCFCESVNMRTPLNGSGDLWIVPKDNKYYVKPLSEKGLKLIKELNLKKSHEPTIPTSINKRKFDMKNLKLLKDLYDCEEWLKQSERCLLCGACMSVCPTCTCFDIMDVVEPSLTGGRRLRFWNSCIFRSFTIVAGGRVVRKEPVDRFKHRYYHKFSFIPDRYEIIGCTGCGRCVTQCHNRIHPLEVITNVLSGGVK